MLLDALVWIAALVNLTVGLRVVLLILQHKKRPNRVTWFVSTLAGWVVFAGQLAEGVLLGALLTAVVSLIRTGVLTATLYAVRQRATAGAATAPRGGPATTGKSPAHPPPGDEFSRLDRTCLALSIAAVIGWVTTGSGAVAIVLSIAAQIIASLPTVTKAWRAPLTEPAMIYTAGMFNSTVTLLNVDDWALANIAFACYFFGWCTLMSFMLLVLPRIRVLFRPRDATPQSAPTSPDPTAGLVPVPIDPQEASAFAGAAAMDYLGFDEHNPDQRHNALLQYLLPGTATSLGWNGRGRQRAEAALPAGTFVGPDGQSLVVDVLARVVPHARTANGTHVPTPPPLPVSAILPGFAAAQPTRTAPGWRALPSRWVRLLVTVSQVSVGGHHELYITAIKPLDEDTMDKLPPAQPAHAAAIAPTWSGG